MPGLIGKAVLASNTWTQLGAALTTDGVVNIRFANPTASAANISVAIRAAAGDPAAVDLITPGVQLEAGLPYEDTAIAVSTGEKVWVKSSAADVVARAHYV